VIPAKAADESTIRLLLVDRKEESLTVYTDGEVHVNTRESHASLTRQWLSPHRSISKDKLAGYLRAFQLHRELYQKLGRDALKHAVPATL
jgi:transposase-like protein